MNRELSLKRRLLFTLVVFFLVLSHVIWDYYHDGVPTHYLLQRADLPGISNWWGILTLPLVTFLLLSWIYRNQKDGADSTKISRSPVKSFLWALIFGIVLSVLFTMGTPIPGYMMLGAIALSFFLPLYRPEYLLGLILGMSYTFGANLSILVALILLLIFLFSYRVIRKSILHLNSKFNKTK